VLQPYLAARLGCPVLYLHGGTAKNARDALVAEFQNAAEPAVFLLSLKAGGTGLNLTAASHVIHFDRWWNRRSRIRPPTGPSASGSARTCRSASSYA